MSGAPLDRLINSRLITGECFQHDAELFFRMAYQRSALYKTDEDTKESPI